MASILVDLGGYIDTNFAGLTLGTNLFYGMMPEAPDNCVALFENGGVSPVFTQGSTKTIKIERPQFQFLVRNTSYETGTALANSIYVFLTQVVNQSINGTQYLRVVAMSNPSVIERDSNKRVIFTCNFDIQRLL